MSFKLLAIRPLKGTSPEFLKILKENCIYQFYNEYEFIINHDSKEIESVRYIPTVPINLYGNNINISAIVGQNGSGKSTLLELLYLFVYNLSQEYYTDLEKDPIKDYKKLNIEIVVSIDNDIYKYKMIYSEGIEGTLPPLDLEFTVEKLENSEFTIVNNQFELLSKFYTNVINYSIYGLNSKVTGDWLNNLFYKNDGYKIPIVINPFRKNGIIDINSEYNLAQQRLVLNYFVIKNETLLHNVKLHSVDYTIDVIKNQYFKVVTENGNRVGKEPIIDELLNFIENNFGSLEGYYFKRFVIWFLDAFKINKSYIKDIQYFIKNKFIIEIDIELQIKHYKYLCILYIFKKLKKISLTYEDFKIYNPLFSTALDGDFLGVGSFKLKNEILGDFVIDSYDILKQDIKKQEELIKKIYVYYINKLSDLVLLDINDKLVFSKLDELVKNHIKTYNNNQNLDQLVDGIFIDLNDNFNMIRQNIFKKYLIKLNNNNDHITFKLKQALNYFKNNQFKKILSSEFDQNFEKHKLQVDDGFINKNINIDEVPLALFEPVIKVQKNVDEPYEFNRLSSGEQQLIHSLLNVVYHTFNVNSKVNSYKNINLIFDEVELYFHPEYQRNFILNLLKSLEYFKGINFNILFSTHSPFILSDIPSQNILKLDNGESKTKDSVNSFAANIYDLLNDEFFLKDGAIGAYSANKINIILKKSNINQEDIDVINLIGDPFLKGVLKKQIENKLSDEVLDKEIERLQNLKRKSENA